MQLLIKDLNLTKTITADWIMQNCYIAGGACVSNATRQPIHDVDIYFKTKEARDLFINELGDDKYITKKSNEWKALVMYDSLLSGGIIDVGDDKQFNELNIKISSDKEDDKIIYIFDTDIYTYTPEPLF